MGIIKRDKIQESGDFYLKEEAFAPKEAALEDHLEEEEIIPVENDLEKAENQAEKVILQARQKSQEMLREAREEAEVIRKEAFEKGAASGRDQGKEESAKKIEEALKVLNEAVKERKKIIKDAESEILRLALRVAEQVIRSEVSLHRDVCLNIISDAISRVSDREQVILRVSHDDVENIKKYKDRISGIVDGVKSFSVLEDSNVESGGCIIETNLGFVDARISTKLAAIEDAFHHLMGREPYDD